ncbi:MAG: PspA/IM30 family protein [Nannocystaceae bacterium]|nr:PspA/IM30 family protein [Nannocystaceae bacterium]
MSDKKPGLLTRLKNSISSTLNSAVDAVSDPGQEVALMLDDLATQIQEAEKDLHQAVVDRKMMERKVEQLAKDETDWEKRAETALRHGDENLARQALKRKTEISAQLAESREALQQQGVLVESMQKHVAQSKQKLKMLNLRRGSLMAQARAAKRGVMPGQLSDGGTLSRIDEIEQRIAALETLNEAQAELSTEVQDAELDAKLSELEGEGKLDDELAALKAKMKAQQSLPSGSEP